MPGLKQHLELLSAPDNAKLLLGMERGIEKESLRVGTDGKLAQTPHSPALGSALTHPRITTDYSEALLEFITPPSAAISDVLSTLEDIHRYTYQQIGDELLWVSSMPCILGDDASIPVAQYGNSNIGRMKTVYRLGLGHRYGRLMQTIAGIHYNWSLPDSAWELLRGNSQFSGSLQAYKSVRYFDLIRNFRRHFWLLLYLFGAAPAVCRSFAMGRKHSLVPFGADNHSLHTPYATSLRMGDLGYQSRAQESLVVCYNEVDSYVRSLRSALTEKYPRYEQLGIFDANGDYRQLSTSLLQIENEFYSVIRPKRTTRSGETPIGALKSRGVEYVEVRSVDLDPYSPVGINPQQAWFLDVFLLHCLLADSTQTDQQEYRHIQQNQHLMVYRGREPELELFTLDGTRNMREWGKELMQSLAAVAEILDRANGHQRYMQSVDHCRELLDDPQKTPSARILAEMESEKLTYFGLAMKYAQQHRDYFCRTPLSAEKEQFYRHLAEESLQEQRQIEANDDCKFEEFLANYFAQYDI